MGLEQQGDLPHDKQFLGLGLIDRGCRPLQYKVKTAQSRSVQYFTIFLIEINCKTCISYRPN